ncbi:MAG: hypothetical protein FWC73_09235 [Defluviitaleaceae bacterium]|nr:hypothetical protein [Defluviitaleaceae bacterium]
MKTLAFCIFMFMLLHVLAACGSNTRRVGNVQVDLGESDRFTHEEIQGAMDVVKETFLESHGRWSELASLWYDERFSNGTIASGDWDKENTIVIDSLYYRGQGYGAGVYWWPGRGFGPARQLMPWIWILSRESPSDPWVFVTDANQELNEP